MLDSADNLVDTESVAEVVEVQRGERTIVCRGSRKKDGIPVLVKSYYPSSRFPAASDDILLYEYETTVALEGCPNLLPVTEFNPNYLVYEGVEGAVFLDSLLVNGPLSLSNLLQIAVHICDALVYFHKKMYLHNSINPSSILVNPLTNETKIFNLAYASQLKKNRSKPAEIPVGQDLAYISPEQTGRYGKSVDFRSDLYSLGIAIYAMATGAPPFTATEAMDLIHAHIAKPPPLAHIANPSVPLALSKVIHKLIEKAPEHRYQSAVGARNDLVHCLHDVQVGRTRKVFELGTSDIFPAPQVSKTLYGRDEEQRELTEILQRKSTELAVVLVVGRTGIGKTALVRSVINAAPGLFASSSCYEESNRPHEGIIATVRSLLMQTMGQGDHQTFQKWKPRIVKLCGPNTAILIEMLPELAPLLGPPMPLEDLPPRERTVRFNMLLIGILKIIAEEFPICLFIDDMHNLDAGALELISMLLVQCASYNITFIAAFRDECLDDPAHLITAMLPTLDQFKPTTIKLSPLTVESTEQLLASALNIVRTEPPRNTSPPPKTTTLHLLSHTPHAESAPREAPASPNTVHSLHVLAQTIHTKTEGNPLYIVRYIAQLHQCGHIKWNWDTAGWDWDITSVRNMPFSLDSSQWVVSLNMLRITPELQRMLQVAAVAGGPFASRVLLELAHLFLEESPATSEGEGEGDTGSVGGDDSDDDNDVARTTASVNSELAHAKIASPSPLRRSGPPSITPIPIGDINSVRSPSRPHTPPSSRTPPPSSPSHGTPLALQSPRGKEAPQLSFPTLERGCTTPPSTSPTFPSPLAKEAPHLSFSNLTLEVPPAKHAERNTTPPSTSPPHTASSLRSPVATDSPHLTLSNLVPRAERGGTTPPSVSPPFSSPIAKEAPQLSLSSIPPWRRAPEGSSTPSQLDSLFRAFPSEGPGRPKLQAPSPWATSTTSALDSPPAAVSAPITIPPPVSLTSPPTSPKIIPRFNRAPRQEVPSPKSTYATSPHPDTSPTAKSAQRERDPSAYRLQRNDSFPRVSSREEVVQAKEEREKKRSETVPRAAVKQQRSMGALPLSTSPPKSRVVLNTPRRRSIDDLGTGTPPPDSGAAPIFTITELPSSTTSATMEPISPLLEACPSPSSSGAQSPEEPDDSAWANFPRVYRGEDREFDGALFRVTTRRLRSVSGLRKVSSQEGVRNKKYAAIVDMLINEAVACSILKVTQEIHGIDHNHDVIISFTHEKLRTSILSQVSNRFARQVHLEYGNVLLNVVGADLYTAVTHLNAAKKLIVSFEARSNLRRLNYRVGSTAKTTGAHESALKYLKVGYDLVRPEEWKSDYVSVFALSLAYAECEFLSGNRPDAMKLFEGLLVKAESVADKARCYSNLIKALVSCGEYADAIRMSCECCRYLGWDINPNPTHQEALEYAKKIQEQMEPKNLEDLLTLPPTTDERIIYLLNVLLTMFDTTYFINVDLFCVISCKMVELTFEYGNSTLTTGGYSMFALAVLCLQMSPTFAYQVDQVAMALLEKYSSSTAVRVKAKILHTFAMYAKHHLRDTLPYYEEAMQSGMHAGDLAFTVYAMIHETHIFYRTCMPVKEVLEHGYRVYDYVANKARFKDMALLLAGLLYPAYAISGDTSFKPLLTVKDIEYLFSKNSPITTNLTTAAWALAAIMEGKYLEEKFDDAFEAGTLSQALKDSLKGSLGFIQLHFYHSLSAVAKYGSSRDEKLLDVVRENQKFLGWWAENCQINGQHLFMLVQAELLRVTGDAQAAMKLYEQSITHAHQHSYLNVEALGYELYAKHLLAQGFNVLASNTFSKAIEVYSLWGAAVKVDLLSSKYGNLVDSLHLRVNTGEPLAHQQRLADLDMMVVVRSLQMLSEGLDSHGLLERFVTLVVQSACAEKGAVVLRSEGNAGSVLASLSAARTSTEKKPPTGEMKVAVFWDVRKAEKPTVLGIRVPVAEFRDLPLDIIQAVSNTEQYVLVRNMQESDFQSKNAAMGVASVMCLPIFRQAHEVVGVMYLEHSSSNVFSRERLRMLELLCVQLGILLQNSLLYESVQESMQMYELLAESLPQMIFCHRHVDYPEYTNKLAQSYLGLTMDQLKLVYKYNFNETIHPNDYPDFVKAWTEAFGKAVTLTAEFRIKRASDNTYRWAMMRSVPVADREGGTLTVTTVGDIDDEHRAKERQLRISRIEASEKRYRLLSEAIPHIIWTMTQNGAAIFFNSKWVEYTGITTDDSYGFGWYHAVHPDDLDTVRRAWAAIGTDRLELEFRIRKWDGEYRWHLSRGIPCYEENSTNLVWFGTATDINDNKVAAMVLTKAREAAEKAAANQALFLANMSHEIRTPLSGLTGMLDLLVDTPLNPEQHDYVDTMHHSAEGLLCIINDILDFSKIEAGKLQLQNEPFNPESAIEVVCEILSIMAVTKDIELVFLVHPGVPPLLHGDPLRLRQVLMNLVGNAIKFTASGEVIVECSLVEAHPDSATLLFSVQDTGCGMTPDDQKSLFNAFYQVDPSITRTHGGTGLGLAICKRLVDLFGGTISVQSAKGVGSTFSFSANFKIVGEQIPKPIPPRHKHTLHVLSVADTPVVRKVVRFYLQQQVVEGYTVSNQEAFNVVQLKDILKSSPKTFQKFIVDVGDDQLPEVIQTIKDYIENPHSPPSTPLNLSLSSSSSSPPRNPPILNPLPSPLPTLSSPSTRLPNITSLITSGARDSPTSSQSPSTPTFFGMPPITPTFAAPPNPFSPGSSSASSSPPIPATPTSAAPPSNPFSSAAASSSSSASPAPPPTPSFSSLSASTNPFSPQAPVLSSSSSSSSSLSLAHHVPAIVIITTPLKRSQYVKICTDVLQGGHANLRTLTKPISRTKLRVALATSPAELAAATGGGEGVGVEEVEIAPTSPPRIVPSPSMEKKSTKAPILIVEDNEVNQKVIRRHVEKWGLKCEVASNGAEAVRLVTQDRPPNYYCLALMDLFMPTVDGFEATRLIREWEHGLPPPGALAPTPSLSSLSSSSSLTSPPSPPPSLPRPASSPFPASPAGGSSSSPTFSRSFPPLAASSSSPAKPSSARSSGQFASPGQSTSSQNGKPNAANDSKKFKRQSSTISRLPIVVLTANVVGDIQEKIFQCGADDMLSKPVDFQKLRALVVHYSFLSTNE